MPGAARFRPISNEDRIVDVTFSFVLEKKWAESTGSRSNDTAARYEVRRARIQPSHIQNSPKTQLCGFHVNRFPHQITDSQLIEPYGFDEGSVLGRLGLEGASPGRSVLLVTLPGYPGTGRTDRHGRIHFA